MFISINYCEGASGMIDLTSTKRPFDLLFISLHLISSFEENVCFCSLLYLITANTQMDTIGINMSAAMCFNSINYLFSIYMYQIQACLSDPLKCVMQPGSSVVLRSVSCISLASALAFVKNSLVNVLGSIESLGLASFLQIGHVPLLCNH